ncbi:hypothetical protein [Geothrix sp. 21YS21S-2]|uniref:hypothetical protein n=1 Tax=Geothrix sp. 21YS21S-2 TaxID=3068893 RepID=UPI0027BA93CC|nr:hypothetical protein [Geothrix sp. 21YS21S-2]
MRIVQIVLMGILSSLACVAQVAECKVGIDSKKVVIWFDGKKRELRGDALPLDDLVFKVEPKPASVIQNVYVWEIAEDPTMENEFGKCFSMSGHRIEFHPKDMVVNVLKGDDLVVWGSKITKGDKTILKVKKIRGLSEFPNAQEAVFRSVQ